jgi:sulfonate transport system permease protein
VRRSLSFILPIAILAAWFLTSEYAGIPKILLPSPGDVLRAFVKLCESGALAHHITMSAFRTLSGFLLAAAVGIGCGVWFACRPTAERVSRYIVEFLRLTPPLALVPVLILWLGIDEAPKIAVVFLSSFFPIYLNAYDAVRSVDPKLSEVAALLKFSPAERFRMLTLPSAMPGILTGLRLGFGYSWRALVGAELIAAASGVGFMITEASEFGQTDVVFVGIFTIVILGIAADAAMTKLLAAFRRFLERRFV